MQNETGNNIGGINDTGTLEAEVRSAVGQGHDVQEIVRQPTLRKISARSLDIESLRQIESAVLNGARAGVQKDLTGLPLAQATSDLLCQIVAGGLPSLADHVKPGHPQGKED